MTQETLRQSESCLSPWSRMPSNWFRSFLIPPALHRWQLRRVFLTAMRLPESANVQVVHAEIMQGSRLLSAASRRMQQSIAADIEITGVSANDIEVLDDALDTHDAAHTVSAHLEQNLAQVEGIDIGSVQGVSMQPLPEDPSAAAATYTGFLEPEEGGCAQWNHLLAVVLALRFCL